MHDPFFVGVIQSDGGLPEDAQQRIFIDNVSIIQNFFQRRTVDKLHENVRETVLFGDVVNGDDVGMGKHAGRLRFTKEPLAQTLTLGLVGKVQQPNRFYSDDAADGGILSPINDPGRTPSKFILYSVSADLFHGSPYKDTTIYR